MKKNYTEPTYTVILLQAADIITSSVTELTLVDRSSGDQWNW